MSTQAATTERRVLERMKERYEQRGYNFIVEPSRDIMPAFLGGHRPDAIALGPKGGVVIEVMLRRSRQSDMRVADLAKQLSGHPDWELAVLYANEAADEDVELALATPQQIGEQLGEVGQFAQGGHHRVAFILCWSILESIARILHGGVSDAPARAWSAGQIVELLATDGYLDPAVAQRLRELARLRNAVVHGDFTVTISSEAVGDMIAAIRSLQPRIGAPLAAQ